MKITRTETAILRIPEDDPLADMPEEAGRLRPIVILRIQTDSGIEGIGLTFYGGALTGTLRSAVDELCALLIGEDPLRDRGNPAQARRSGRQFTAVPASTPWQSRRSTSRCGTSRARRSSSRCGNCSAAGATVSPPMHRARCGAG